MSDRKDAYYLQLVNEAFYDESFDDLEDADRLLSVDMGFIGIVSGVLATEHVAPPDLTIDVTAGVSYDQAGRRCGITSAVSGLNCAVDENAVATTVAAPGNERWLSIQLRFDRTLTDLQVDGNGNNVFVDQDESYELAVVMGPEQAAGTGLAGPAYTGRPALPADGRLVCDVVLLFGTTQIFNADINTDRRQDFSIFSGAAIPVTSGAWTWLNPATDDIQATFDFIDTYSITTNSSREAIQNIIPSASGRNLGEPAKEWDLDVGELLTIAATRVDGDLIPKADGNDLGTAALQWTLWTDMIVLAGNFDLDGEIAPSAASRWDGDFLPKTAANDLGSAALPWDLYLRTLTTDASSRITGDLWPTAGGQDLGSAALPWDLFSEVITSAHATVSGAIVMSAAKTIQRRIRVGSPSQNMASLDWEWARTLTLWARTLGDTWSDNATGPGAYASWEADIPDGVTLTELHWTYGIEVTSGAVTANAEVYLYKKANTGVITLIGSATTFATTGAWQDDAAVFTGKSEVIDLSANTYYIVVRSAGTAGDITTRVVGFRVTYTGIDVGKAAIGG